MIAQVLRPAGFDQFGHMLFECLTKAGETVLLTAVQLMFELRNR